MFAYVVYNCAYVLDTNHSLRGRTVILTHGKDLTEKTLLENVLYYVKKLLFRGLFLTGLKHSVFHKIGVKHDTYLNQ